MNDFASSWRERWTTSLQEIWFKSLMFSIFINELENGVECVIRLLVTWRWEIQIFSSVKES